MFSTAVTKAIFALDNKENSSLLNILQQSCKTKKNT